MDYQFYQKYLAVCIKKTEDQKNKEKAAELRAKEKKKRKLDLIDPLF